CLFLNVWTAADMGGAKPAANRPVLFFIHGGGNTEGSGAVAVYNGASLAKQGVVVVNINYRLSGLGFMAHPDLSAENGGSSGNWAIQDEIAALHWVHDNIAAFGGDPAKVTIAGQSAGGGSVNTLLVSPLAKGLFQRAVVESGGAGASPGPLATAEQAGVTALTGWGVKTIAEARALPFDKVIGRGGTVADGKVVPKSPSPPPMASDVPVMIGYNLNEAAPIARTAAAWKTEAQDRYGANADAFLKAYPGATDAQASDSAMRETSARGNLTTIANWVARRTGGTKPVYTYFFTHVEPGPQSAQYGAFHTSEIPYFYGNLDRSPGRTFTDLDRRVSSQASSFLVNFIKTGNPNGPGLPQWTPMTPQNKAVMEIGDTIHASRVFPDGADDIVTAGRAPGARAGAPAPAAVPAGGRGG
ncbi:MAG: Carboxylic ester hydrolase, partial [Caulobacteraceae bacterium]|nr:Carboxylic ester hydrolase [Caulobacteraceae bacterium]